MEMNFCYKCGTRLIAESCFCHACGTKILVDADFAPQATNTASPNVKCEEPMDVSSASLSNFSVGDSEAVEEAPNVTLSSNRGESSNAKIKIDILSIVSLVVSILGAVFYSKSFDSISLIPVFVIIAITSVILPPIAKKHRISNNKTGKWLEIGAIVIGGFNFYCIFFALTTLPIFIGYLGWLICGVVYKLASPIKKEPLAATQTSAPLYQDSQNAATQNKKIWGIILALAVIFALIAGYYIIEVRATTPEKPAMTTPRPTSTPMPLPETGQVYIGDHLYRGSLLTIDNTQSSSSCYIKLKNSSGKDVFSFFVRAGDYIEMEVPSGDHYVYFAAGEEWYGRISCFGEKTEYYKDDELREFRKTSTWEYTLYPVTNGNFTETSISKDEFK